MAKANEIIDRSGERGSSMVESLFSLLLLLLIFFGFLQIFKMSAVKMLCDYSAYCTARGRALGYRYYITERAARVPLMPVSGEEVTEETAAAFGSSSYGRLSSPDYSTIFLRSRAYMMYGPAVVDFAYWDKDNDKNSTGTDQYVNTSLTGNSYDASYAQNLVQARSGFNAYPSGFEFLDPQYNRRMTISANRGETYTATDDSLIYNTPYFPVIMQNYSRFIITEEYWNGQ